MIAYHYSITYQGDPSLQNDYHKRSLLAEPYIRALENGSSVFSAMLLMAMYHNRYLRSEKREWFEYAKDATEAAFEYIRKTEFPGKISRINCIYAAEKLEEIRRQAKEDWGTDPENYEKLQILELELDPQRTVMYDQCFFNQAYDCMQDYHGEQDLQKVMDLARSYYREERSGSFIAELLSDGENKILRVLQK